MSGMYVNQEERMVINKIEALKSKLILSHRITGSLNNGSILKYVTSIPDHNNLIEIKAGINQFIEKSNLQRKINSQFEWIFETLNPKSITENMVLNEFHKELVIITNTIITMRAR